MNVYIRCVQSGGRMVESFEIVNILILGNRQQQTKINKRLISRVDHGEGGRGEGRRREGGRGEKWPDN